MDAQEYDRIADLLMQIRRKYAKTTTRNAQIKKEILDHLEKLIELNDWAGELDAMGWL